MPSPPRSHVYMRFFSTTTLRCCFFASGAVTRFLVKEAGRVVSFKKGGPSFLCGERGVGGRRGKLRARNASPRKGKGRWVFPGGGLGVAIAQREGEGCWR
jgi:8-oxo-dGTP pyrophosphatase MutT (NUDIX family)